MASGSSVPNNSSSSPQKQSLETCQSFKSFWDCGNDDDDDDDGWMDVGSIETLTWLMASISAINLSSSILLYSAMAIDFALSALSVWSSDSSCFVILLDMHSSSLNRGLLMAAMELLPTVYWKPPPQKKTLNNKKKLHTKDAGCFCLLLLLSDLLE